MKLDFLFSAIASLFKFIFEFVELLGNIPNWIFIIVLVVLLAYWLRLQKKFNKEAQENNTLS